MPVGRVARREMGNPRNGEEHAGEAGLTVTTVSQPVSVRSVLVLGTGVIGTSVALALRRAGVEVRLSDPDAAALTAAVRMGAGDALTPNDEPADVVVIASPPSTVADVLCDAVARSLGRAYTDVAGVKGRIIAQASRAGCDLSRYVPGHPVVAGDLALLPGADADLFAGRHWYLCPLPETEAEARQAIVSVVQKCGALYRDRTPDAHDRHMAAVSHLPRLITSAVAALFEDADESLFPVRGSRFHETMHVPGVAPGLWADTVEHNADHVAEALEKLTDELSAVARALRREGTTAQPALARLLAAGKRGHDRVVAHACKTSPGGDGIPGPEEEWFWVR
jgi:prephenate dehydrogenase